MNGPYEPGEQAPSAPPGPPPLPQSPYAPVPPAAVPPPAAPWQAPGSWPQPQPQPQPQQPAAQTQPLGGYPTAAAGYPPPYHPEPGPFPPAGYPGVAGPYAGLMPSPAAEPGAGAGGRSRALIPLAVLTVLALLFAAGSALWWSGERSSRAEEITALTAAHATHRRTMDQRQAALDASYRAVALDTRWAALATANDKQSAVSEALNKKYPKTTYVLTADAFALVASRRDCFVSLIEYNRGAAQFSDTMRGTLPSQVDMTDPETNCSAVEWHD